MAIAAGTHTLGPENATLSIRTKKGGAASMAGHNLLIEVTDWSATLTLGAEPSDTTIELTVNSGSLKVLEGTGGAMSLDDEHRASIKETIDKEVLKRTPITFRSTAVEAGSDGAGLRVTGELELAGRRKPITFDLSSGADGALTGSAIVKQTNWGMKPYSALFGTLKVLDDVTVEIAATLPQA
jgi:polyisoprenoid-binding protein YceI